MLRVTCRSSLTDRLRVVTVGLHVWLAPSIDPHAKKINILDQLAAEDGGGWAGLNLAQAHNDLVSLAHMPADMRFTQGWISNGENSSQLPDCDPLCEFESTGYTGAFLARRELLTTSVQPDLKLKLFSAGKCCVPGMVNIPGTDRVLISYDKTTGAYDNGTVPTRVGNHSYIFVMQLRFNYSAE